MTIWTRAMLAAGLALVAAGCGTATSSQQARPTSAPARSATGLARSSLLGASWVSATEGWALAARSCGKTTCALLARTADGGRRWHGLPEPPAEIPVSTADCSARPCVSQVSFASTAIGYLYGPALLMTTDGGLTWHAQTGPQTETLTIASGRAYRVSYTSTGCPGPCQPSLTEAPAGSANWHTLIGRLAEPGRSDSAQIVASGPDLLLAMYGSLAGPVPAQAVVYRSADGGESWQQAADPCDRLGPQGPNQEEDLVGLAAAPGGFFAGLCAPHNIASTFVITSADAGAHWQPTASPPPGPDLDLVAAASPATIAVATGATSGNGTYTARLLATTDGGRHWVAAATDTLKNLPAAGVPAWLSFETPLAGHWLADQHGIWATTDGGRHWARMAFPG